MKAVNKRTVLLSLAALTVAGLLAIVTAAILDARRAARVDSLIAALADDSTAPAARDALSRCRSRSEIRRILSHFEFHPNPRSSAVLAAPEPIRSDIPLIIGRIGRPAVRPVAEELLDLMWPRGRGIWRDFSWQGSGYHDGQFYKGLAACARALGDPLVDELESAGRSRTATRRAAAVAALAWVGGERARAAALAFIEDPSPVIRQQVAQGLGMARDPRAVEPLLRLAGDGDVEVAQSVASALYSLAQSTDTAPATLTALKDPALPPLCRSHIITGLQQSRLPAAFDAVLPFLKDADVNLRWAAAYTLCVIDESRASAPLAGALADSNLNVARQAHNFFDSAAQPGMVEALLDAYATASDPSHKTEIIKALIAVRDGRHAGYGTTPPADLVAKLRKDAAAALERIETAEKAQLSRPAAQPLPLDSTATR
jgi:HEAT repeat protein